MHKYPCVSLFLYCTMNNLKQKTIVIGIGGGSGSGKTTLLRRLGDFFNQEDPAIFSMDNYYKPITEQEKDNQGIINFDLPSALNEDLLTTDLITLAAGHPIEVKEYFFNSNPNKNVLLTIQPSKIIIVEGLFLFHYERANSLLDYTIFVDVDYDIQLDRRIYRDQETRGYSRSDIIYQWENHALPCYKSYILPYKNRANFIYRNDHRADEDFQKLTVSMAQELPKT
jgi:uridine kinase